MLELKNITQRYDYQKVLDDISMTFPDVGFISIVGPSGCGKSTLLSIIGGLQKDYVGEIYYNHQNITKKQHSYRRNHVGFIFQQYHLIMWLNAATNIHLSHYFHSQAQQLKPLNISAFEHLKMKALSGGQRQRIAFLRATFQQKDILLCDEPTGSLDPQNADEVMQQLYLESKYRLVIVVSHDLELVKKYSHEIYEMKDGQIKAHHILKVGPLPLKKETKVVKKWFPHFRLSFRSLLSHKKRTLQLMIGLTLSLLCILITLTLSRQLEKQIQNYLYAMIPPSSISFQSVHKQSLSLDHVSMFSSREDIERTQLFLDDYELLGVGFVKERYQESQTLFIGDDASPYEHLQLKYGRYPVNNEDIVLSYSTAQHLCQSTDVSKIIDQTLYAWYKHDNHVKAIAYHVVGVSQNTSVVDTFYQKENAYIPMLQEVYQFQDFQCHLGMIYIQPAYQRQNVIQLLKQDYPLYKFIESGVSTSQQISQTMNQVEWVLLLFSLLAILSSLFLIGEVMFLNVIQKKKDYAIMICFGAKIKDIVCLVILESFEVLLSAWVIVLFVYMQFLQFASMIGEKLLGEKMLVFSFDYRLLATVFLASVLLILLSQFLPVITIMKMDSVEALKG